MRDLLGEFSSAILDPARPVPDGVVGPDGLPSARRFAVYRNNVVVGLIDTLAAAYPVVERLVGAPFFKAMAAAYAVRHPPRSPIMLDYGDGFADFIATFPPASPVPYLADVARIERAWVEAYHEREAVPATPQQLATIPPERFGDAVLVLHPTIRLLSSPFPAVTIWQMNSAGANPDPVDRTDGSENALIVRCAAEVEVRRLAPDSLFFVGALQQGATPSDAAKQALRVNPRFDLLDNLVAVIGLGLVIGWDFDGRRRHLGGGDHEHSYEHIPA
ncbi:MAG: DNA-binding domain-containing protein [Mesorhizobium sp.]